MANIQITQLPAAGPITGTESVPVVQNGVTVRTTTAAIAASPAQTQTFLTLNQEPTLPNSRALQVQTGLTLTDGGAQGALTIGMNGAAASLNAAGTGIQVKTNSSTVTPRSIAVGTSGLSIADGNGVSGNPTLSLTGQVLSLANASGAGILALPNNGTVTPVIMTGTADQITVTNGNGAAGNPTFSFANNPVFPGTASVTLPAGGTGDRPLVATNGELRYNTDTETFEGYANGNWGSIAAGAGVTSVDASGGTTGMTFTGGPITSTGVLTLGGTLGVANGGTGQTALVGYVYGNGPSVMTASLTIPVTDLSGTLSVPSGGTGAVTLTGYVKGSGTSALTASSTIPVADLSGTLPVSSGGTGATTLTGYVKGNGTSAMSASATVPTTDLSGTVSNAQLANSTITINGDVVSLGGSTTITPSSIGAISSVSGTANEITATTVGTAVTVSLPNALTFTGKTVTGGTYASPAVTGTIKFTGTGAGSYTPFVQTFASYVTNYNGYQLNYIQNTNNGSEASVDYVAYNDASDVDSYFIDMGINSSNYTSVTYPIFPANSAYLFTGGGTSGQASSLYLGTSNSASDVVLFTGDVTTSAVRATIKGNTGNFLIGTATDTGYQLNVAGTTYFGGASTFGSTVTLNANPASPLEAATKQYVDQQVTAGIHIHEPVRVETTGNLNATYVQGGTTFNITTITSGTTVTTSVNHGLSVNDQIWLYTSAGNGLSTNTAYFVYSTPAANQLTLSLTYGGAQITGLTNATGLTYPTRANSGVGATLTNAGAQAALSIDGISLSVNDRVMVRLQTNGEENGVYVVTTVGSGATNWVLTRATDANIVSPTDTNGLGTGDYFYTQEGLLNAGDSHVLTTEPNTMIIGYTPLTYTQFSGSVDYVGGTNITVSGQTISVSGTIAATLGGTGTSTVAVGDLLYGSATDTWSNLPLGTAYKSLIVNASGTQVEWNAVPLNQSTAVSGQLGVSNGGTALSSYTTGDMLYASGSTTLTQLTIGAAGYVLTSSGTAPQYVAQSTLSVGSATNATNATNTGITADSTNADNYLTFVSATTGNLPQLVNSSITCNPSTGTITAGIAGGTF